MWRSFGIGASPGRPCSGSLGCRPGARVGRGRLGHDRRVPTDMGSLDLELHCTSERSDRGTTEGGRAAEHAVCWDAFGRAGAAGGAADHPTTGAPDAAAPVAHRGTTGAEAVAEHATGRIALGRVGACGGRSRRPHPHRCHRVAITRAAYRRTLRERGAPPSALQARPLSGGPAAARTAAGPRTHRCTRRRRRAGGHPLGDAGQQ